MKSTFKLTALSITCLFITTFARSTPFQIALNKSLNTFEETVLEFKLSEYKVSSIIINNRECTNIILNGASLLQKKGFPALPLISQSIIIPNNAAMGVEILNAHYTELSVKKVTPSRGLIYRDQNPSAIPYTFNEIYTKDIWYPKKCISLGAPYIIRDMRGIVVTFFPFQYNPAKGIVRVIDNIKVKIKRNGEGKVNTLKAPKKLTSREFVKAYRKRFLNYTSLRSFYTPLKDGDKMIVISASDYINQLSEFVEWKNVKGIKTDLYEYPSQTGSGSSILKSFIQDKYDSEKFTYLLLVGDSEDIPSLKSSGETSDPSYYLLAGNDKYPDIFGGRFSVGNTSDIQTLVDKSIHYEKEPDPSGAWYHKAMGVASNDGGWSGATDWEHMDRYRTKMLAYNYTEMDKVYDPGARTSDVSDGLNEGRSWVNYMGHGLANTWGTSGFSSDDVSDLTNGDMLPVIISVACINGDFAGKTCFAEEFTRAQNKGAIAFLGSTIYQSWTPPQTAMAEMVDLLCADTYISIGGIIYNGEMEMLEDGNDGNTYKTWTLFGDPSLQAFTDTPKELQVTHPDIITGGQQNMNITFGTSIKGRVCVYSEENGILASKIVDGASSATLSVTVTTEKEILLTVTALNKIPYQKKIGDSSPIITSNTSHSHYAMTYYNSMLFYTIPKSSASSSLVSIKLYNAQGKLIKVLVNAHQRSGHYRVNLNNDANHFAAGVFFAKMAADDFNKTIRIVKK